MILNCGPHALAELMFLEFYFAHRHNDTLLCAFINLKQNPGKMHQLLNLSFSVNDKDAYVFVFLLGLLHTKMFNTFFRSNGKYYAMSFGT